MPSTNNNNYKAQKLRGIKRKYEAIIYKGGKCENCGYNKNMAALEFHHINPAEKSFQLDARHFANSNLELLKQELSKCKLLCSNCHRAEHNKDFELSEIPDLIKDCDKKSFSTKHSNNICPVCGNTFPKCGGKIYCSKECRNKYKNYPSKQEVLEQYEILKSWEKVATYFGITRRIVQGIRKREY